ncbi:MAG TPA: phosphodiester glycosidase family protein [Actinomycetota bacterium]
MGQLQRIRPTPGAHVPREDRAPEDRRRHRARRAVALAVVALLIPVGWSYANALTAPGSAPLAARTVEWIKDHGGRGLVLWAERLWYSRHQPPVGGTPAGGLPYAAPTPASSPVGKVAAKVPPHLDPPADVAPIASNPLPHEGAWQTVGRTADGLPAIRVAFLRPDPVHTSLVAGVAWMDTRLLRGALVAGTQVPGGTLWQQQWGAEVPRALRNRLVATFNSGFLLQDSHGGYFANGRTYAPLEGGAASVVVYRDGTVTVGRWGQDVTMSPMVAAVRQNLHLIVDHGRPVPGLATDSLQQWGATLGNAVMVWRSGLGVTRDGALLYAGGPGLSVESLASVLARAGAVRAMELDINTDWVSFNYYTTAPASSWGVGAHELLPTMVRSADRYLVPDERDFFAMFLRPRFAKAG